MSLLLLLLHTVAHADEQSNPIEQLYNRQHSIERSGVVQQDLKHWLPSGDSVYGFVVSHKDTVDDNFENLRLIVVDKNKKSAIEHCDIGLVGYYFISSSDYQKLVGEQSTIKIENHYHIFFDESDKNASKKMTEAYDKIIADGCS